MATNLFKMSKAGSFIAPQGKDYPDHEKTIFIWLDILGFADALEDERRYGKLAELLYIFQQGFSECHAYNCRIIPDGIILWLKQPSINSFSQVLNEIGKQQFRFTLETEEFIRGGISLGSKFGDTCSGKCDNSQYVSANSDIISNGLARAVKLESKDVTWPIIGTTAHDLIRICKFFPGVPVDENFDLLRGFNARGEDVYFVDFLEESQKMLCLINSKIENFKDNYQVRAKYIWLLKYYIDRFGLQKYDPSIKGAVL